MTDKYDDRVEHLDDPIFKSSDALALPKLEGGGWMLKFRVDWRARAPNNEAMGLRAPRKKCYGTQAPATNPFGTLKVGGHKTSGI